MQRGRSLENKSNHSRSSNKRSHSQLEKSKSQRGQFASEANKTQTEKALEEHEQLKQEKTKLMKYIVVTKSKHEKEISSLQKQLNSEKEQVSFLSEKAKSLVNTQTEAENTTKHLRNQLEKAFGKVRSIRYENSSQKHFWAFIEAIESSYYVLTKVKLFNYLRPGI